MTTAISSTFTIICDKESSTYKSHILELNVYGILRVYDGDNNLIRVYSPSGYNHVDFDVNLGEDE